jgi:hypothetical protein
MLTKCDVMNEVFCTSDVIGVNPGDLIGQLLFEAYGALANSGQLLTQFFDTPRQPGAPRK